MKIEFRGVLQPETPEQRAEREQRAAQETAAWVARMEARWRAPTGWFASLPAAMQAALAEHEAAEGKVIVSHDLHSALDALRDAVLASNDLRVALAFNEVAAIAHCTGILP